MLATRQFTAYKHKILWCHLCRSKKTRHKENTNQNCGKNSFSCILKQKNTSFSFVDYYYKLHQAIIATTFGKIVATSFFLEVRFLCVLYPKKLHYIARRLLLSYYHQSSNGPSQPKQSSTDGPVASFFSTLLVKLTGQNKSLRTRHKVPKVKQRIFILTLCFRHKMFQIK